MCSLEPRLLISLLNAAKEQPSGWLSQRNSSPLAHGCGAEQLKTWLIWLFLGCKLQ